MVGRLKLLFLSVLFVSTYAFSQSGLGTLRGTVSDEATKAPLEFSKVLLKQAGAIRGSSLTDEKGKFQINGIQPGSYDVEVRNAEGGYQTLTMTGVSISSKPCARYEARMRDNTRSRWALTAGVKSRIPRGGVTLAMVSIVSRDGTFDRQPPAESVAH